MSTKFETEIERKHTRRLKNEDAIIAREERRDRQAAPLIGELCRNGRAVFYVTVGGYREGTKTDLVSLLVRRGAIR